LSGNFLRCDSMGKPKRNHFVFFFEREDLNRFTKPFSLFQNFEQFYISFCVGKIFPRSHYDSHSSCWTDFLVFFEKWSWFLSPTSQVIFHVTQQQAVLNGTTGDFPLYAIVLNFKFWKPKFFASFLLFLELIDGFVHKLFGATPFGFQLWLKFKCHRYSSSSTAFMNSLKMLRLFEPYYSSICLKMSLIPHTRHIQ